MDFIERVWLSLANRYNLKIVFNAVLTFFNFLKIKILLCILKWNGVGLLQHDKNGKRYLLNYYHGTEFYTMVIPYERRINNMMEVNSCSNEDVTASIKKVMGPCHNFHKIPSTPKLLGYSKLSIRYRNGENKEYDSDDIITF